MKVQYILPFVLLAIVSCKQNESIFNEDNNKAIFSGSIHQMQTRVSGTSWDANDTIGICMYATGTNTISNGIDNYAYVTTGDGYFSPSIEEQTIYYPLDKSAVDFVAYYPYRNWAGYCFYVDNWNSTRQDTLDLLVANVSNKSQKDPEAELSFYHQFSKLVLNISANSETGLTDGDLAGMTVSIAGINKPAHCILLNKTVEYGESLTENVSMKVSADGKSASAIIPSTTGSSVIFTLADGSTYTWDISSQCFESGKLYPYAITLKATPNYVEARLGSLINDWNTEDSSEFNINQDIISGTLNGHDYVDLGLPSGTMWATCNVGAGSPEGYGKYYAWGETKAYEEEDMSNERNYSFASTYTKNVYSWNTYKYSSSNSGSSIIKYISSNNKDSIGYKDGIFIGDGKLVLDSIDDAASVNWEAGWRTPTVEEFNELKENCFWTWNSRDGINGFSIVSRNGNSIFLPVSGYHYFSALSSANECGLFWTASINQTRSYQAYCLYISDHFLYGDSWDRDYGATIRPVCSPSNN